MIISNYKFSRHSLLIFGWVFDVINAFVFFFGAYVPIGVLSKLLIYVMLRIKISEIIILIILFSIYLLSLMVTDNFGVADIILLIKIVMPPFIFLAISRVQLTHRFCNEMLFSMAAALFSYSVMFIFTLVTDIGFKNYGERFFGTSSFFRAGNEVAPIIFIYQAILIELHYFLKKKVGNVCKLILLTSSSIYILLGTFTGFILFSFMVLWYFAVSFKKFISLGIRNRIKLSNSVTVGCFLLLLYVALEIIGFITEKLPRIIEKSNLATIIFPRHFLYDHGAGYFSSISVKQLFLGSGSDYMTVIADSIQSSVWFQLTYTKTSFEMDPLDIFAFSGLVLLVCYVVCLFLLLRRIWEARKIRAIWIVCPLMLLSLTVGHIWMVMPIIFAGSIYFKLIEKSDHERSDNAFISA